MKLDRSDRVLLKMLYENARHSLKELAVGAGLSSPSTAERIRRLEERGLVTGYSARISVKAFGLSIEALVRVRPLPGRTRFVEERIRNLPAATECDKITGEDCFVVRIFARSVEELDAATEILAEEAVTNTSIVKRQLFSPRTPDSLGLGGGLGD